MIWVNERPAKMGPRAETILANVEIGTGDNRPATVRLIMVRDGGKLVTLEEVVFTDDTKGEWLVRNRTTLERQGE